MLFGSCLSVVLDIRVTASKAFSITLIVLVITTSLECLLVVPRLSHESTPSLKELLEVSYRHDDKKFMFLPSILSNSNFTKDPSKVIDIELMAHVTAVNNQKDLVSLVPLFSKPKKGKSQIVTPTLPKSHGLEAFRALSKKRQKLKFKKPPTKTKVTSPKPT
nr:hypothetical protein [Tanacetum cinerariifolium]